MGKINDFKTIEERRLFAEEKAGVSLKNISTAFIDNPEDVHCENLIGAISLPLGIAGPVTINDQEMKKKEYFIPLATTEGALVASVSRGCKAISESSGVEVVVTSVGTTRGPVFQTTGIVEGMKLKTWVEEHVEIIAQKVESTSQYLKLNKIDSTIVGDKAYFRCYFDTTDAMGMNMATIASNAFIELVETETGVRCISIAGNYDIDKKPGWINFISGRGKQVWAEASISSEIVSSVLKTSTEKICEVWLSKCMIGSAISGSLGFNSHFANIVAAFFAATGQDLAHITEGSLGITTTKVMLDGALYIAIYMPDVMIGTIGGGTGLATQKEAQNITGVTTSTELAKILGAAVLAGELSLLASLAEGSLVTAHKKLGR